MPLAVITGGSRGFGRAVTSALLDEGWHVITDARNPEDLAALRNRPHEEQLTTIPGDVAESDHRQAIASAVKKASGLDLLINNASELGPSPLPDLLHHPLEALQRVYTVNVVAPLALIQLLVPHMTQTAAVVNVSSDAGAEAYPTWGGYGSSKAALDHVTRVLAAEHPAIAWYAFDPGDMRTGMHQAAYPDEDISDRPEPESVVPALLRLLQDRPPSGRYRAADLLEPVPAGV
jgi:NAD(P)-dependent dehydrogenase (short-subunit alcohol dehydrogenase family)